jgi:hypothetical protein
MAISREDIGTGVCTARTDLATVCVAVVIMVIGISITDGEREAVTVGGCTTMVEAGS